MIKKPGADADDDDDNKLHFWCDAIDEGRLTVIDVGDVAKGGCRY